MTQTRQKWIIKLKRKGNDRKADRNVRFFADFAEIDIYISHFIRFKKSYVWDNILLRTERYGLGKRREQMKALERNRMVRMIECMNRHEDLCKRMNVVNESTFRGKRVKEVKDNGSTSIRKDS